MWPDQLTNLKLKTIRRNRGCGMKRRKDNRCTRFHEVWYNKQGTWNSVPHILRNALWTKMLSTTAWTHSISQSESQASSHVLPPNHLFWERGQGTTHSYHSLWLLPCFQCEKTAAKDLNYRVEGKRPFTEPTKATPVEQRCQVFLEEFLDCNSWTAWSLLLKIKYHHALPPWSSRKVVKWMMLFLLHFFFHFWCAKRYLIHVRYRQSKLMQTASLRCAQYKGVALLTGLMTPLPNVKLARPQNFRCHLSVWLSVESFFQTASTATGSKKWSWYPLVN